MLCFVSFVAEKVIAWCGVETELNRIVSADAQFDVERYRMMAQTG